MVRSTTARSSTKVRDPLATFVRLFLSDKRAEGKSQNYINWLTQMLRQYLSWSETEYGRDAILKDFTAQNVREFIISEQSRKRWLNHPFHKNDSRVVKDTTINGEVRALKVLGKWLLNEGYTTVNPMAVVKVLKTEQYELDPLTEEEEKKLIRACDDRTAAGARRLAIVLLFLDSGIRRQEMVDLKEKDVHFEDGYITVMGKGRKQRSIPFGRKTERALRRYYDFYREPATFQSEEYFFLDTNGYQMTANAAKMVFERMKKRTGIERLHPHLLRHTYGVRNIEGGVSTLVLQSRMGHSSPEVTELYTHATQSERIKRDRSFSHVDMLDIRVRKVSKKASSK